MTTWLLNWLKFDGWLTPLIFAIFMAMQKASNTLLLCSVSLFRWLCLRLLWLQRVCYRCLFSINIQKCKWQNARNIVVGNMNTIMTNCSHIWVPSLFPCIPSKYCTQHLPNAVEVTGTELLPLPAENAGDKTWHCATVCWICMLQCSRALKLWLDDDAKAAVAGVYGQIRWAVLCTETLFCLSLFHLDFIWIL